MSKRDWLVVCIVLVGTIVAAVQISPGRQEGLRPPTGREEKAEVDGLEEQAAPTREALDGVSRVVQDGGRRGDCDWFIPWKTRFRSLASASELLESMRPVSFDALACLPAEWKICCALSYCRGDARVTGAEFDMVMTSLIREGGDLADAIRQIQVGEVDPRWFTCLVTSFLEMGLEREHVGRLCGAFLVSRYGGLGSLTQTDPAVVEALRAMMADWPVLEDAWWAGVWQGMPLSELNAALNIRLALYEALALVVSEQEWIDRLRFFVQLENDQDPGHTLALLSLGQCLGRQLPITVYAELVGRAQDSTWMKALVYGFPEDARWPSKGYLSMPETLSEDLSGLLNSDEYRWKNEFTMYQWDVLGPIVAVGNLESFYLNGDPSDADWDGTAAAHVYSVLRALSWPSVPEGDEVHLVTAQALVRDLVLTSDAHDVTRLFDKLQGSMQLSIESRAVLAELLGPEVVSTLSPEVQAWLSP